MSMSNAKLLEIYAGGELLPRTPINSHNNTALYTKKSLGVMIKLVSTILERKCNQRDIRSIADFLNTVSATKYEGNSYQKALRMLADDYLEYIRPKDVDDDLLLANYEQNESRFLTNDESLLKFSSFPKTHQSHIDEERRELRKSEIDRTPPSTNDDANKSIVYLTEMIKNVLSEENRTAILTHLRGLQSTYQSVQIPRQSIRLDSRNRNIPTSNLYTLSWNLQFAGQGVELGNIKLKRPLQEVIKFNVKPFYFWLIQPYGGEPTYGLLSGDLDINPMTITMQVTEFNAQGIQSSIPRENDLNKAYEYHIAFDPKAYRQDSTFQSRFCLVPLDEFTFMKPFAKLSSISIRFFFDFIPLMIMPDTFKYSSIVKVGTTMTISGMFGAIADQYKAAIYYGNPNFETLPVRYPKEIGILNKSNQLNYKTPLHILKVSTGNSITDTLLMSEIGWLATLSILADSDILTTDDTLVIDLSQDRLGLQPDFSITDGEILVTLDILATSLTMEFICLEMPSN